MTLPMVLLTATVTPNAPSLSGTLSDAGERLHQYRRSVRRWADAARLYGFNLAVVETSGSSEPELFRDVAKRDRSAIQFVPYSPLPGLVARGKGAAELGAVQDALRRLEGLTDVSTVYKVTGRLVLENCNILDSLSPNGLRVRMTLDRSFADTRVLGASCTVWRDLLQDSDEVMNDENGVFLEHFIAGRASYGAAVGQISLSRFPRRPILTGQSGATGIRYSAAKGRMRATALTWAEGKLAALAALKQS